VKVAILGCSTGAELYSAVWMLRSASPRQEVRAVGIDISAECIEIAARGVYPVRSTEVGELSETACERLFVRQGQSLRVQDWLRDGVTWSVDDASSDALVSRLGAQDAVFANNFLFHMPSDRAEHCLRSIARLVAPNRYLFISGVDLDLRARCLRELGFTPLPARLEEIYTAEEGMLSAWPLHFWGLEPIDRRRSDWLSRYSTVFKRSGRGAQCSTLL
jgi:hypothetical protein